MRNFLLLIPALGLGCGPGMAWTDPVAPTPAPASAPPRLHVDGARLRDDAGNEVRLRGVNVCSLEFDATGANWQLAEDGGSPVLDALAAPSRWSANVVRMPVNQEWFLTDDAYVGLVERIIDAAAVRGLYVILDVQWEHAVPTDPYQLNILKVPTFGEGLTTEAFWHLAGSRFANRENLLMDLINEPHDVPAADVAASMQRLVDKIHGRDPAPLIIIAGPDWAHSVAYYRDHPVRGGNLIYDAHQYLPYDTADRFRDNFERTAELAPVLISEFSSEPEYADYRSALLDRAKASGVDGWMPWAIGCGFTINDDVRLSDR